MNALRAAVCALAAWAACGGALAEPRALTAGVDAAFAPHVMRSPRGALEGFNVDLLAAVAKQMARRIDLAPAAFADLLPALESGRIDLVGAPLTATPERARAFAFTEGYLDAHAQLVAGPRAGELRTLADLKGRTVAVARGTAYEQWAHANGPRYAFRVEAASDDAAAIALVTAGRADAALTAHTAAAYAVMRHAGKARLVAAKVDEGRVFALAFRKTDTALRDAADEALECLKQDGTLARLHEKWFGLAPEPRAAAVTVQPGYGVPGLAGHAATAHRAQCR